MGKEEKRKKKAKAPPAASVATAAAAVANVHFVQGGGRSMFFLLCLDPLFLSHFSVSVFLCARVCSILIRLVWFE